MAGADGGSRALSLYYWHARTMGVTTKIFFFAICRGEEGAVALSSLFRPSTISLWIRRSAQNPKNSFGASACCMSAISCSRQLG